MANFVIACVAGLALEVNEGAWRFCQEQSVGGTPNIKFRPRIRFIPGAGLFVLDYEDYEITYQAFASHEFTTNRVVCV